MKAVLTILLITLLWPIMAQAEHLGMLFDADTVTFELFCLDSDGNVAAADSAQVTVRHSRRPTINSFDYSATSGAGAGSAGWIDTVAYGGVTHYYFWDAVQDIDGSAGDGLYSGTVLLFSGGEPTPNRFTFIKINDEVYTLLDYLDAAVSSRSTLVASDNIGLNWADIDNPTSAQTLSSTTVGVATSVTNMVSANLSQISGDSNAADNLEDLLDGGGSAVVFELDSLAVRKIVVGGENDDQASLYVFNTGQAPAGKFNGTGGSGSSGLFIHSDSGHGLFAQTEGRTRVGSQWAYAGFGADHKGQFGYGAKFSQSSEDTSCVGAGLWVMSAGAGDAWRLSAGIPDDTVAGHMPRANHALESTGSWLLTGRGGSDHFYDETVLELRGKRQGMGLYVKTDSAMYAAQFDGGVTGSGVGIKGGSSGGDDLRLGSDGSGSVHGSIVAADTNALGEVLAVMPDDWSAADSTAYQGAAAGLDSATVARAVWNAPGQNHQVGSSFGSFLDTTISSVPASACGSGAFAVTIVAYDTVLDQTVPGVEVAVRNLDQTSLLAFAGTGPDGTVGLNLDAGSYLVTATAPGYIFAAFDTMTVSGASTDSLSGYRFDPGTPSSPSLCRIYGSLFGMNGQAEVGVTVSAHLPSGVTRISGVIISPFPVTTTTDDNGYFYIDLIPSALLTGSPLYEISINRSDGTILRKRLAVPDTSSWKVTW